MHNVSRCGHAMFNAGSIGFQEVVLTILYSIAGLGIAIVVRETPPRMCMCMCMHMHVHLHTHMYGLLPASHTCYFLQWPLAE